MTFDATSITSSLGASAHAPELSLPGGRLADAQETFARALNRARGEAPESREARAQEAAEELVAITFVQPILAQLRETNNAAAPFGPTPAEKQFGSLQDARLAQDIVRASRFPLVDRLARNMLSDSEPGAAAPVSQGGRHAGDTLHIPDA
ncbi:MAG: hypothetical protein ACIARR_11995 [Phycisphaerales bacterium JB059]